MIINRYIKWAPFIRPTLFEGLNEVLRPDVNRKIQQGNVQQSDEDEDEDEDNDKDDDKDDDKEEDIEENEDADENNPEKYINQWGENELDDMEDNVEEIIHRQFKGSRIRHQLKTSLNS